MCTLHQLDVLGEVSSLPSPKLVSYLNREKQTGQLIIHYVTLHKEILLELVIQSVIVSSLGNHSQKDLS